MTSVIKIIPKAQNALFIINPESQTKTSLTYMGGEGGVLQYLKSFLEVVDYPSPVSVVYIVAFVSGS